MADKKQPFLTHLEELRKRIIICVIAIGIGFIGSYAFSKQLFNLLTLPLKAVLPADSNLIYTNLPEMFIAHIKTSLIVGIILATPVIFYQIWKFLAPALLQNEKKYMFPFVFFSTILFVIGASFGYFIVFPYGFEFFVSFATDDIQALPSVKQYFSFAIRLLFAFGIVFEMPVAILFMTKLGIITPDLMRKYRKYAFLSAFIISAILTPPDVATQVMMALPIIVLFEISIFISKGVYKKKDSGSNE